MVYDTGQRKDSPARNASRPGSRSDVRRGYSYRLITEPASLLVGRLSGRNWEAKTSLVDKSPMQCAGINRHEAGNERVLRERSSEPLGPEFCVAHREVIGEA